MNEAKNGEDEITNIGNKNKKLNVFNPASTKPKRRKTMMILNHIKNIGAQNMIHMQKATWTLKSRMSLSIT